MTTRTPDQTCRDLRHALDAAKARLHAAPLRATAGESSTGLEAHDDDAIYAEIARLEVALHENGCL